MKVVIAGGGTAGHVMPAIAVADALRERGATVEFVGSATGPEAAMAPGAGYPFHGLAATPFRRQLSLRTAAAPVVALRSLAAARPIVRDAHAVLGMGGYASIAPVLAARSQRIPIVLHEQNAVPGLANRVMAPLAAAVAVTFRSSRLRLRGSARTEVTGIPLRPEVRAVPERRDDLAAEARDAMSLDVDRTTVFVTGGSQGALHIDRTVAAAIPSLAGRGDLQLLVQTGRGHEDVVAGSAGRADLLVRVVPFLDRMELALAIADVAVARAGANTVHELAVCGVPSILVPYPHATGNHQEANARELERAGAAEVLLDRDLSPDGLAARIGALVDDDGRRAAMSRQARGWATPDADARVADLVLGMAT